MLLGLLHPYRGFLGLAAATGGALLLAHSGCVLDRSGADSSGGAGGTAASGTGGVTQGSGGSAATGPGAGGSTGAAGGGGSDPCGGNCQPSEVCDGYGNCVSGTPDNHLVIGDGSSFQRAWSVAVRSGTDDVMVAGTFTGNVTFNILTSALDRAGFALLLNPGFGIPWATTVDGANGDEQAFGISVDSNGHAILTGDYTGFTPVTQGGPLPAEEGGRNAYVVKLRPAEALADFALGWGGASVETAVRSAIGNNNDIYVCGYFDTEIDLPAQTVMASNQTDAFLVRLNSSGAEQWYQRVAGDDVQLINDVSFDNGRVAIVGTFEREIFLNPLDTNNNNTHNSGSGFVGLLSEVDGTATQLIAIGQDNNSDDAAEGVTFDSNGDVLIAGHFTGLVDFDGPGSIPEATAQGTDMFLLKVSTTGTVLNAITFGDNGTDELYDVEVDADGNIVVVGSTDSNDLTVNGTSLPTNGNYDAVIIKLNRDFEVLWAQRLGGSGNDNFIDAATDSMSRIYAVGAINSAIEFGAVTTAHFGGEDIFIARFRP